VPAVECCRVRFAFCGLQFDETAVGTEVLTVITGFVTVDEIEGAGLIGKRSEGGAGEGSAGLGAGSPPAWDSCFICFARQLVSRAHTRVRRQRAYGHHFDKIFFGGADGAEFREQVGCEGLERFLIFRRGATMQELRAPCFEGVARGGEFALLTTGSALCFYVAGIRPDRFTLGFACRLAREAWI